MTGENARRILRSTLFLVGAGSLLAYVAVAVPRITFPFELEWSEGSIADHVHRIVSGQQVYAAPSIDFVATMYTPGYYYVAALFALVFGEGFVALRLVAFLASLAILGLIFAIVRKETGDRYAAALGAFLFAATFRETGGWFDVGRPDSLFLALLLAAAYRLRFAAAAREFAIAGLFLAAAILTKQTALLLGAPLFAYACFAGRRGAIVFAVSCAGALLVFGGLLEWRSAGWFSYYVGATTGVERYKIWIDELLLPMPVACLGALWLAYGGSATFADRRRGCAFYSLAALGLIGGSYFVNIQRHTAPNALMPPFACLAILFGIFLHESLRRVEAGGTGRTALFIYTLGLLQFATLAYNPWRLLPTSADEAGSRRLIEAIRAVDGPVLVYDRGSLARLAGKPGHASRVPVAALNDRAARAVSAQFSAAIREGRYAAVVLTSPREFASELAYRYLPAERILPEDKVPKTVTFSDPNPNLFYRRRPPGDVPSVGDGLP